MKDVQCYEFFGGIPLINNAFFPSFFIRYNAIITYIITIILIITVIINIMIFVIQVLLIVTEMHYVLT